jgi:hypothetical protein
LRGLLRLAELLKLHQVTWARRGKELAFFLFICLDMQQIVMRIFMLLEGLEELALLFFFILINSEWLNLTVRLKVGL